VYVWCEGWVGWDRLESCDDVYIPLIGRKSEDCSPSLFVWMIVLVCPDRASRLVQFRQVTLSLVKARMVPMFVESDSQ
jgi:hypothetical protein